MQSSETEGGETAGVEALLERFRNPGNAYRGKPFWSWNGLLDKDELLRQIDVIEKMGLGGFFMHSRTGLGTEYLGREWMDLTNVCADEGERRGMEAWLYDEDRWPSGTAGGMVTQHPEYRMKYVGLRTKRGDEFEWGDGVLAAFSCQLEGLSYTNCERIGPETPPAAYREKTVLVFAVEEMGRSTFYNGYTYVDTLKREATECFLKLTHERYKERCGDRLGRSIRGIFTDEPHRGAAMTAFELANENGRWMLPWTEKLPEEYERRFGGDVLEKLPEVFLQPEGRRLTQAKWRYMELLQAMFLENFLKPMHAWCEAHGLRLTGHLLHEDSLTAQVSTVGSVMRCYEFQHDPGVDVLTEGNRNYWIVKQLSSAARQLGQKWLMSELYGCTGWQMGFEGHKAVGDWQALFGINFRCHHLSWYTMAGEAKRDFPASLFHQSPWWEDYRYVEDYFARLGVMLTPGRPRCDVLVINPVESVWAQIHPGWAEGMEGKAEWVGDLEEGYQALFFWLAGAQLDFDYGDEEMMGRLGAVEAGGEGEPVLRVGQMRYRVVLVGRMTTMRQSTVRLLDAFREAGGKVIFVGDPPKYVDALPSNAATELAKRVTRVNWDREAVRDACKAEADWPVQVVDAGTGAALEEVFCQVREVEGRLHVVLMNMSRAEAYADALVRIEGSGYITEWDCASGQRCVVPAEAENGRLTFRTSFAPTGERVYVVDAEAPGELPGRMVFQEADRQACEGPYAYELGEPNVCVLDRASYRIDEEPWEAEREILKVDQAVRDRFGLPRRAGQMVQPWYRDKFEGKPAVKGKVSLAYRFEVEVLPGHHPILCVEQPERFRITLNGREIGPGSPDEWWVDVAFRKCLVPKEALVEGENELRLETDFGQTVDLEAVYLLGDFGVRVEGTRCVLTSLPAKLEAGDVTGQGLAFYGGPIIYRVPVEAEVREDEAVYLETGSFEGACVKVHGDGRGRMIAWPPYRAEVTDLVRELKVLDVEVVLTRRNTFGPLHQVPLKTWAYGPESFITSGEAFTEGHNLYPAGLLEAPRLCRGSVGWMGG